MTITETSIPGVLLITPRLFEDERGYFFESFNQREFERQVGKVDFVQDNESRSTYGVIRGLHYQRPPYSQAKLVRVIQGEVMDVVLDIRPDSPTFGQHASVILTGDNHQQLFIPKGLAHGFVVLSETATFQYKCDDYYHPEAEAGIQALDPALGIDWGIDLASLLRSPKDKVLPLFADAL